MIPDVLAQVVKWFRENHFKTCFYCGIQLTPSPQDGKQIDTSRTLDHIIPKVRKGNLIGYKNIVPSCHRCNNLKQEKRYEDFRIIFYGSWKPFYGESLYFSTHRPKRQPPL